MFDIDKAKRESGLNPQIVSQIEEKVREDFDDQMMFELHLIRTLHALKEGKLTVEQLLAEAVSR